MDSYILNVDPLTFPEAAPQSSYFIFDFLGYIDCHNIE